MKIGIIIISAIALLCVGIYIRLAWDKRRETRMLKRIDENSGKRAVEYNNKLKNKK